MRYDVRVEPALEARAVQEGLIALKPAHWKLLSRFSFAVAAAAFLGKVVLEEHFVTHGPWTRDPMTGHMHFLQVHARFAYITGGQRWELALLHYIFGMALVISLYAGFRENR